MRNTLGDKNKSLRIVLGDIRFFEKTRRGQELKLAFDKYFDCREYLDPEMKKALKLAKGGDTKKLEEILIHKGLNEIILENRNKIIQKLDLYQKQFLNTPPKKYLYTKRFPQK